MRIPREKRVNLAATRLICVHVSSPKIHTKSKLILGSNPGQIFRCKNCPKTYKHRSSCSRHMLYECGKDPVFICHICHNTFHIKGNLKSHLIRTHNITGRQ